MGDFVPDSPNTPCCLISAAIDERHEPRSVIFSAGFEAGKHPERIWLHLRRDQAGDDKLTCILIFFSQACDVVVFPNLVNGEVQLFADNLLQSFDAREPRDTSHVSLHLLPAVSFDRIGWVRGVQVQLIRHADDGRFVV